CPLAGLLGDLLVVRSGGGGEQALLLDARARPTGAVLGPVGGSGGMVGSSQLTPGARRGRRLRELGALRLTRAGELHVAGGSELVGGRTFARVRLRHRIALRNLTEVRVRV